MSKFCDLTSDGGFKVVFCNSKNSSNLILLLNTFLPKEARVKEITKYLDREFEIETVGDKQSRLDLHCLNERDEEIIVEMQYTSVFNNYYRFIYYCARTFCSNTTKGDILYTGLRPVYMIVLLNTDFLEKDAKGDKDLVSYISVINKDPNKSTQNSMNWIFVRLFLMKKERYEDCTTDEERCVWMLKNLHEQGDYQEWMQSSKYKDFAYSAEIANFDTETKKEYDKDMTTKKYYEAVAETRYILGKQEGEARGLEQGKAEGFAEGKYEVAKSMLANGIDISLIATCTNLSIEQISSL